MYWVYILQSEKNSRYYIGSTNDVERRIVEHNAGKTKSLRYLRPLKIVFQKQYETKADAMNIERRLKKLKNRGIIEKIVEDQDITLGL